MTGLDGRDWSAELADGRIVTGREAYFTDIRTPIRRLKVMGVSFEEGDAYYLVFHARATVGRMGELVGVEAGELIRGTDIVSGLRWGRDMVSHVTYDRRAGFPFAEVLRSGVDKG